jgi:hypothetical protein
VSGHNPFDVCAAPTVNFANCNIRSYLAAGYEYVNIDDCWSELERDKDGKIIADKKRFPRGIKFLSDYVSAACS